MTLDVAASFADPASDPFRAVFESAPEAMLILDDAQRPVEVNPAACALYGITRAEFLGRVVGEFVPPALAELFQQEWQSLIRTGHLAGEFQIQRADG